MSKNIFNFELKQYLQSAITWTIVAITMLVLLLFMFPMFEEQSATFVEMLNSYPKEMLEGFGIKPESFQSAVGFYSISSIYTLIILSIYASNMGLRLFSLEKSNGINEYLLTKPVKRDEVFITKYLVGFMCITITVLIYSIITFILFPIIDSQGDNLGNLFNMNLGLYMIVIFIYCFSVFIASILKKIKIITAISVPIVLGFYSISMIARIVGDDKLKYLSPFGIFDMNDIILNGLNYLSVIMVLIISLLLVISSLIMYNKKDII